MRKDSSPGVYVSSRAALYVNVSRKGTLSLVWSSWAGERTVFAWRIAVLGLCSVGDVHGSVKFHC